MSDDREKRDDRPGREDIRIDYKNIDVADIMAQIKKNIRSRPGEDTVPVRAEGGMKPDSSTDSAEQGEASIPPSKVKALLLKLMKPFSPIIKLLVLPVHHELRETVYSLDRTNRRLDFQSAHLNDVLDEIKTNLGRFNSETNKRVDLAFEDLTRAREYVKLLHNLSHNIVVELTKLKIEEENLKSRIRILEKDFENLKNREKALESRVIQ